MGLLARAYAALARIAQPAPAMESRLSMEPEPGPILPHADLTPEAREMLDTIPEFEPDPTPPTPAPKPLRGSARERVMLERARRRM